MCSPNSKDPKFITRASCLYPRKNREIIVHCILKIIALLAISGCSSEPVATNASFVYHNFVGEGRPEYKIIAHQVELRITPKSESSIGGTEANLKGQSISFNNAITRTIEAGKINVLNDVSIKVRGFGEIETLTKESYYDESNTWIEKTITAADQPTVLMWISEGNCLITIKRTVNESSECPTESTKQWALLSQPRTESWIEVKINNSTGWVKIDGQQIIEVSRSF